MGSSSSKCEECADCGDLQEELERTQEELAAAKNQQVITPIYKVPTGNQSGAQIILNPNATGQVVGVPRAWGGSRRSRRPRRSRRKSHKKRNSK
jgi:hypothetical protein